MILLGETILVVAAHPDDEVLGCGGAIARHVGLGDQVHILIMAEGVNARNMAPENSNNRKKLTELGQSANRASKILGVSSLILNNFPDNRLDSLDLLDVIKVIEKQINKLKPSTVYTHHAFDLNIDHQLVSKAVFTACRPIPGETVRRILFFEVPSNTEWSLPSSVHVFTPQYFIDITKNLKTKLDALKAYKTEIKPWPHPRSIRGVNHLARWRGASVGCEAAEAFVVGRFII